ncbi:DUF1206 domain-containing protein [Blastococcus brunescens]|uniref:DUF1206 domain-containing protein n=1 Tax=Blastococcus brunescens TaxID=1564165 RepID=A0ABZ1AV50_9ACTN|nr:DUF1206 domain-containing protein [Blastococcus sp. BMG 8361]WRL62324.1 DUF1206 domain-containing protein [Blastococcus sp. BMG 8361]
MLGGTALLFAAGAGYEADERLQELTDDTLLIPGGAALVVVVALGVIAVGLYTLVRGFTAGFMRDIDLPAAPDRWEPLIEGSAGSGTSPRASRSAWSACCSGGRPSRPTSRRRPASTAP